MTFTAETLNFSRKASPPDAREKTWSRLHRALLPLAHWLLVINLLSLTHLQCAQNTAACAQERARLIAVSSLAVETDSGGLSCPPLVVSQLTY